MSNQLDLSEDMAMRVALVGDSHARRLFEAWMRVLPTSATGVRIEFFGFGGLGLAGGEFCQEYLRHIVGFHPHICFIWIGGNDLAQDKNVRDFQG